MYKKKALILTLIMALVFSNLSMVYGMNDISNQDLSSTESSIEGDDNDEDEVTTDEAITEQGIDDGQNEEQPPEKKIKTNAIEAQATVTFYVKLMAKNGTAANIKTVSESSEKTAFVNAHNYMVNSYNGSTGGNSGYKGKSGLVVMDKSGKVVDMIKGLAYVRSSSATATIGNSYVTPKDMLNFKKVSSFSTTAAKSKVRVTISGLTGDLSISSVTLIPDSLVYNGSSNRYYKDYYTKNSSGDMIHYVYKVTGPTNSKPYTSGGTGSAQPHPVDKAPSWMKLGTRYYSEDGVNFYTDVYLTAGRKTYYPYYMFLPFRSTSSYSSSSLNKWINYKTATVSPKNKTSKLKNQGTNLINTQNRYGINAVNELAFACLESAYGKSNFALTRNNLFGINAVDASPGKANYFSSAGTCIKTHAEKHLSRGYGDAKTDYRYFGLTPGNKGAGINVKYASDPYHGEKISGIAYSVDRYLGSKDYRKYTVGVTNKDSVRVYKTAGTSSYLYNLSNKSQGNGPKGIPVVILGSSGSYYMIQSDLPVSGNTAKFSYTYYYDKSIAYVKKSDISVVNNGVNTYSNKISSNRDLRTLYLYVGSKNYLSSFDPGKTYYTVTVPKNTKTVKIKASPLMTVSQVTGSGTKNPNKKTKTYSVKVKSKSGSTKTYKIKVQPKGKSTKSFNFGVYNSKTKLSNKSVKGKRTTSSRPMKIQSRVKTNSKRTTVKMYIYNSNKKIVARKVQYIYKTKTLNFSWNGQYTYHNKLNKKAGTYAPTSKSGTKYYVRMTASRSGVSHKGSYETFYLYK